MKRMKLGWSLLLVLALLMALLTACSGPAGEQGPQGVQGEQGAPGTNGDGILSITKTGTEGLVDTYTITYTNGDTTTFTVTNGAQGQQGLQGIQGIQGEKGADGHTPVITIQNGNWYIDGADTGKSADGIKGDTGNGISSVAKTGTEGLVDTYTITYTNGDTTTFTVTNGAQGQQGLQGIQGIPGKDGETPVITIQGGYWYIDGVNTNQSAEGLKGETGNGISAIAKTGTEGLVDTYTITYTNGDTTTFTVTNGAQGQQGAPGIQGVPGKDGETPVITIQGGYWYINGVNTTQSAVGMQGETGNGISSIAKTGSEGLVDTYTITYTNGDTDTFTVTNGAQGAPGIQGVPGNDGHTPVVTIQNGYWYVDGVNTNQSAVGIQGETGNGISSIAKTGSEGLVDTYTITYTNGDTDTFTVTNGAQGAPGIQGVPGNDGHTPIITIQNGNWYIDGIDSGKSAVGEKGDTGLSAYQIYLLHNPSYTGSEQEWIEDYVNGTLTKYTVTFDLNGGTVDGEFSNSISANYGKTISLAVPTRTGYTFLGWYTGMTVVDGIFTTTDVVTGDLNLIARWQINTFTVTFLDYYGGTISIQTIDYGASATAPAVPSEIGGIPFYGWNKTFTAVTSDMTVSALYSRSIYTVTYHTDGGSEILPEGVYYGDIPVKPADPEKPGFTFAGWFLERSFTTEYKFDYALDANTTLYAKMNGDYTIITTAEELAAIANNPAGKYVLGNDINYKGDIWTPIETFSGIFDGAGYRIYNFVLSGTSTLEGFIRTNNGTMKNIVFDEFACVYDIYVYASTRPTVGIVTGINNGTIDNCELRTGEIGITISKKGHSETLYALAGGFAGQNSGLISHCANDVDISFTTSVVNTYNGYASTSCLLTMNIWVGGIAGGNAKDIVNCTVNNKVISVNSAANGTGYGGGDKGGTNKVYVGGIVGCNNLDGATVSECVADIDMDFTYSPGGNKTAYIGQIVGYTNNNNTVIENCLALGSIDVEFVDNMDEAMWTEINVGGIIGAIEGTGSKVSNSYADVNITTSDNMKGNKGGIVGNSLAGNSILKTIYVGNMNIGSYEGYSYGMIAGAQAGATHLCYYSSSSTLKVNGATATPTCTVGTSEALATLQSEAFIYATLYWDADIWSVVEGQNPTLKS